MSNTGFPQGQPGKEEKNKQQNMTTAGENNPDKNRRQALEWEEAEHPGAQQHGSGNMTDNQDGKSGSFSVNVMALTINTQ